MAKKNEGNNHKNKFAESILTIGRRFSAPKAFDDFLTMTIAACTRNPATGLSYYEDEYLQIIAPYKDSELRFEFPKAFAHLVHEMDTRLSSDKGNDVLGEFYEMHISHGHNGEFFTPYPICQFMARVTANEKVTDEERPLRILDPACGSGRMLVAAKMVMGSGHEYYGIDINHTCVKMTALNLFLNGMWKSEVMCANALIPEDFTFAYRISFVPLGIFKIEEKEKSALWHMHQNSFVKKQNRGSDAIPNPRPFIEVPKTDSTQLDLFK